MKLLESQVLSDAERRAGGAAEEIGVHWHVADPPSKPSNVIIAPDRDQDFSWWYDELERTISG